jgi:peptide-methionine (R)-S-oxide reductase
MNKIVKSNDEWRKQLSHEEYRVTRKKGTERARSHPLNQEQRAGIYHCVCCGEELFDANSKFESGSGWPSFFQPTSQDAIVEHADRSLFRTRTEVRCTKCDAHLGHVFDDGPEPTGLRYCMNGTALKFDASN